MYIYFMYLYIKPLGKSKTKKDNLVYFREYKTHSKVLRKSLSLWWTMNTDKQMLKCLWIRNCMSQCWLILQESNNFDYPKSIIANFLQVNSNVIKSCILIWPWKRSFPRWPSLPFVNDNYAAKLHCQLLYNACL